MTEPGTEQVNGAASAFTESTAGDGWEWAVVEIFGHRKHAGRTREEERFGAKMLRVDIPKVDPGGAITGWETLYYGGSSIFSYGLTDETSVIRANKPWAAASRLSLAGPDDREYSDDDDPA